MPRHATGLRVAAILLVAVVGLPLAGAVTPPPAADAAAVACPPPGGRAVAEAPSVPGAELLVRGHGWGHSLGMSQYGAQGAARLGCDHVQILTTYYAGSRVATVPLGRAVLMTLLVDGTSATVEAQSGPVRWQAVAAGVIATQPPGSRWTVVQRSGGSLVRDAAGRDVLWVARGGELRALEQGVVARVRTASGTATVTDLRLRWDYSRFVATSSGLQAVQVVQDDARGAGPQKYLWGLAEVPASWPQEALRAQAVAARSYLARRFDPGRGAYVIGTTTATQNYGGYAHESADAAGGGRWRSAVDATRGRVVTSSSGAVLDALYSSSHGGRSEDARYAYGTDVPSLRSVDDSAWDLASDNPYRSWSKAFSRSEVAKALGLSSVSSISLAAPGTPARHTGASVAGVRAGTSVVLQLEGMDLRTRLGLRSPGVTTFTWAAPPTPPAPALPLVGDVDGDGVDEVAWFRAGDFTVRRAGGAADRFRFGRAGDVAVVGDWDGDGRDGIGVFRAGQWFLRETASAGPAQRVVGYGRAGDVPVVGRWPGAAGFGLGVVRGRTWFFRHAVAGGVSDSSRVYGVPGDRPVVGDWDDDGAATPAVVRDGSWLLSDGPQVVFGRAGDQPAPGDFDGGGRTTPGLARGTTFHWRDDLLGGPATGSVTFAP